MEESVQSARSTRTGPGQNGPLRMAPGCGAQGFTVLTPSSRTQCHSRAQLCDGQYTNFLRAVVRLPGSDRAYALPGGIGWHCIAGSIGGALTQPAPRFM